MQKITFIYFKIKSLALVTLSLLLTTALFSYNQNDPSIHLSTICLPTNLLSYFGSYLSDILYQFMGRVSFFVPIVFTSWSYLIYKNEFLSWKILKVTFLIFSTTCISVGLSNESIEFFPDNSGGYVGTYVLNIINRYLKKSDYSISLMSLLVGIPAFFVTLGISSKAYIKIIFYIGNLVINVFSYINITKSMIHFFKVFFSSNYFPKIKKVTKSHVGIESVLGCKIQPRVLHVTNKKNLIINQLRRKKKLATLPSIELLDEISNQNIQLQSLSELEKKSQEILVALADFGIKGNIMNIRQGPVVTIYEFKPTAGTKSSRIIGLSDDISRSLSAYSTRISVILGTNVLGIELPNEKRSFFCLKELVKSKEFQNQSIVLPIILGKDLSGHPIIADLSKMPHLLVAGTTGSGKSVAINAMIMSLLYRYSPSECKMIMIDPKMLELSSYNNIPHLLTPVVTEPSNAVLTLKWVVKEMENRYRLMSHLGVRSISNFNTKISEAIKEGKILKCKIETGVDSVTGKSIEEVVPIDMNKMPFIVIIVDEMADLMLVAGKEIEILIQRLSQMARAAGIHIIMATQRPSVDVITGVIKANFPSRISFKVISKIDSRTILGEQGSEQLLGLGDMLYIGSNTKMTRIHGPFVNDKEVERVTSFLRSTSVPDYLSDITELKDNCFINKVNNLEIE